MSINMSAIYERPKSHKENELDSLRARLCVMTFLYAGLILSNIQTSVYFL